MHYLPEAYVFYARTLTYLLTYFHGWLWAYKTGNISETVEDRAKVSIMAYIKQESCAAAKMTARCAIYMGP